MNFFTKIAAIIYHTYDQKGLDIPHFRTITTIVMILFLHIVHIGLIFNLPSDYIMPWNSKANKSSQWLYASLYFGGFIALIALIFRKKKLDSINVTQKQIDRSRIIIPVYLVVCLILLVALLVKSGVDKGKINL